MGLIPAKDPWQRRVINVQDDLTCVHCGYNLQGLTLSGQCPECGRSIWDSLLRRDIPDMYRSVKRGSLACMALAAWPILLAQLIAVGPQGANALIVLPISLLSNILALTCATLLWLTLPTWQLRPSGQARGLIIGGLGLTILALIASVIITYLQMNWTQAAWRCVLVLVACHQMLLLAGPARLLVVMERQRAARLIYLAQGLCILLAMYGFAALLQELDLTAGRIGTGIWLLAAVVGFFCAAASGTAAAELQRASRA